MVRSPAFRQSEAPPMAGFAWLLGRCAGSACRWWAGVEAQQPSGKAAGWMGFNASLFPHWYCFPVRSTGDLGFIILNSHVNGWSPQVKVNGQLTSSLTQQQIGVALRQTRPLRLTLARPVGHVGYVGRASAARGSGPKAREAGMVLTLEAKEADERLGFKAGGTWICWGWGFLWSSESLTPQKTKSFICPHDLVRGLCQRLGFSVGFTGLPHCWNLRFLHCSAFQLHQPQDFRHTHRSDQANLPGLKAHLPVLPPGSSGPRGEASGWSLCGKAVPQPMGREARLALEGCPGGAQWTEIVRDVAGMNCATGWGDDGGCGS